MKIYIALQKMYTQIYTFFKRKTPSLLTTAVTWDRQTHKQTTTTTKKKKKKDKTKFQKDDI